MGSAVLCVGDISTSIESIVSMCKVALMPVRERRTYVVVLGAYTRLYWCWHSFPLLLSLRCYHRTKCCVYTNAFMHTHTHTTTLYHFSLFDLIWIYSFGKWMQANFIINIYWRGKTVEQFRRTIIRQTFVLCKLKMCLLSFCFFVCFLEAHWINKYKNQFSGSMHVSIAR